MTQLTKLNKLADTYFRAPLCSLKWILISAGVKMQQQSTFKVKCKLHTEILERKQLYSFPPKTTSHSITRVHLADIVNDLWKKIPLA